MRMQSLNDASSTRPSLLIAIRDHEDQEAWGQFVEIYTPLLFRHCLKLGLQEADAADVSQEVMKAVAQAIRKFEYDRSRGTFRAWLLTVTRSKLNNHFASCSRQPKGAGDTAAFDQLEAMPGPEDLADWEEEFRQQLFRVASDRVRDEFQDKTWQAFWRTAVMHEPVAEVARSLGQSVGAIYIARSRVLARLREWIERISTESDLIHELD